MYISSMCLYPIVKNNTYLNPYTFLQGLFLHRIVENYFIFGVQLTIFKLGFPKSCLLWLSIGWGENFLVFLVFLAGYSCNTCFVGLQGFILFWLLIPREYMLLKKFLFMFLLLFIYGHFLLLLVACSNLGIQLFIYIGATCLIYMGGYVIIN